MIQRVSSDFNMAKSRPEMKTYHFHIRSNPKKLIVLSKLLNQEQHLQKVKVAKTNNIECEHLSKKKGTKKQE